MNHEEKRAFKDGLYGEFARIGRALGHARRLELLDVLAQGERTVEELAGETAMPVASASQHLRTMLRARLVVNRREGTYAYYRLSSLGVVDVVRALHRVGEEHLAEIDRLLAAVGLREEQGREMTLEELKSAMDDGSVSLLDVRPRLEFDQGHIAGARSVPLEELSDYLGELSSDREVVAYCRGRYCVFAHEAVRLLRSHGVRARKLRDGFPEWKRAGYPVSQAA
ncbi:MAG: metalloregulator ArsR/SmtB family transcription factor [Rhodothermales bacterium]